MDIDIPEVLAEMQAVFAAYETAFVTNDTAALDRFFWDSIKTVRYGVCEMQHGFAEVAAFRAAYPPVDLPRDLARTVITTFGRDAATASTLFYRASAPGKVGRQMQTWMRMADGWKVVAAHVSLIDE